MCPEGFVLGPDWKNCDDVDECAAGDNHDEIIMKIEIMIIIIMILMIIIIIKA